MIDDALSAGHILVRAKVAAERRPHAERVEVGGRYAKTRQPLGIVTLGHRRLPVAYRGGAFETSWRGRRSRGSS